MLSIGFKIRLNKQHDLAVVWRAYASTLGYKICHASLTGAQLKPQFGLKLIMGISILNNPHIYPFYG